MDFSVLQHPAVLAGAVVAGLAGLVLQLLAYRKFKALKLGHNAPMPAPLLYQFVGGGCLVSLALLVYLLPMA